MEQLDQEFTHELQQWCETPPTERDLAAGAELFHKLRPQDRNLYRSFLIRPQVHAARLEHELKKHLQIRLQGYTLRQVAVLDKIVVPKVAAELNTGFRGKREDHDSLPVEIKELYDKNGVIFEKMKLLYNTLLGMEKAPSCDRFEHLSPLQDLDNQYRDNWNKYDNFKPADKESEIPSDDKESEIPPDDEHGGDVAGPTAKEVSAARKFISTNLHKLETCPLDEKQRNELLRSIYERVVVCEESGGTFKPDMAERLRKAGIDV